MPTLRNLIIELSIMTAVGFVLAAIGPYGSFAIGGFATRLAYWLPAAFAGYAIVRPITALTALAARRLDLPTPLAFAGGVLLAAAPMTPLIRWLGGNDPRDKVPFEGWFQLYLQVALIGGGVTLLFYLIERPRGAGASAGFNPAPAANEDATASPGAPSEPPPFLARLPAHLREGLVALEMEDHYVRAHSAQGSALILLRMRDAVAELGGIEGLQVHRSWWVAKDAVERITRSGRSVSLELKGGLHAPVARNSLQALREAGWLGEATDAT